jgi:hypothetical protein
MSFLIFLDFDGVLHSHWGPHSQRFYFLPRFEAVLRNFPRAQVVIASSWGLRQDLQMLRSYFSADIQRRVIGASSFTEEPARTWYGRGHRAAAASRFIEKHGLSDRPWVALDDEPSFWQPGAPLIACRGGFCELEELLLRMVGRRYSGSPDAISLMDDLLRIYFPRDTSRAKRFFLKHYPSIGGECLSANRFERICATDPEFVNVLATHSEKDEEP